MTAGSSQESVPVGELPTVLAQYFAALLEVTVAAGPWLAGELPVPMAQLRALVEAVRRVDELAVTLRGECHAVYRLIQAERARLEVAA